MKTFKRGLMGIFLVFGIGAGLAACGGSGSASSGPTMAQFNALQAQVQALQTQLDTVQSGQQANQTAIADLQSGQQANQTAIADLQSSSTAVSSLKLAIVAPNAMAARRARLRAPNTSTASPPACLTIGTLTGHPQTSDPISSGVLSGISCTGYYFNVSEAPASADGDLQELTNGVLVGFDGAGCTGNAYVEPGAQFAAVSVESGVVFVMDTANAGGTPDYANAANYWYVPAAESETSYTAASYYLFGTGCHSAQPVQTGGFMAAANDSAVTGEISAPIAGPVLPGSP